VYCMITNDQFAKSHFELVGGQAAVDRIVDIFYLRMETLPEAASVRALHSPDLNRSKAVLKEYLAEWLGGPPLYSQARGQPRLRMRHLPFWIGALERDAWMLCMTAAMREVVGPNRLCELLLQMLSKTAHRMRNDDIAR
jgi:hemoglobin